MKDSIRAEVTTFFRTFALQVLQQAHVDPNDPRGMKLALLDHYEEIYPRFSLTPVFHACYKKAGHAKMVEEYRVACGAFAGILDISIFHLSLV